jgi:hypothetical protein
MHKRFDTSPANRRLVAEIRALGARTGRGPGQLTQRAIAKRFGISELASRCIGTTCSVESPLRPQSHSQRPPGSYRNSCCRNSVARNHSRLKAAYRLRTSRARTRFAKSRSRQYHADASPALRCRARRPVSEVNGIVGI